MPHQFPNRQIVQTMRESAVLLRRLVADEIPADRRHELAEAYADALEPMSDDLAHRLNVGDPENSDG